MLFTLLGAKGTPTGTLSCAQLHKRSERVACLLVERGRVNSGDHVALVYPPGPIPTHFERLVRHGLAEGPPPVFQRAHWFTVTSLSLESQSAAEESTGHALCVCLGPVLM